MTRQQKNRVRAILLLVVFSLNTVAGFACSLGVDMGYNAKHHSHEGHSHLKPQGHKHCPQHWHTQKAVSNAKLKGMIDDCCTNDVTSFAQLEKIAAHNNLLLQAPIFIVTHKAVLPASREELGPTVNSRFQFVRRSCFLNDTDLQTAIRRFQI